MKKSLILFFMSLILFSCDDEADVQDPNQEDSAEINIKEDVVVITQDNSQLVSDDDQIRNGTYVLEFSGDIPEVVLNDVLVLEQEGGYLRRVVNVVLDGNIMTLETVQANMEDVFDQAEFSFTSNISPQSRNSSNSNSPISESVQFNYIADGVNVSEFGLVFDFSNTIIYQDGSLNFKITNGTATFDPNFTFDFDFEDGKLEYFQFKADNANLAINCGIQLAVTGSVNLFEGETILVDYDRYITFFAGIVPVVVVVNTKLEAKLSVDATAEIGFTSGFINESIVNIGVTYDDGNWNGIYQATNIFDSKPLDADNTVSLNQSLIITPKVSTQIYSVLGPYISPEMTENFKIAKNPNDDWDAELKAGVHPKIGVEAEVFGNSLLDFYLDITPIEEVVYQSPKNITIISGNEQTGQQGQQIEEALKVKVTDDLDFALSEVPVYFYVNPDDGTVSEQIVMTNEDGFAEVNWTLGTINTSQGLVAKVKKANGDFIESVAEFTAEADEASLQLSGDLDFGNVTTIDTDQRTLTLTNVTMGIVNVLSLDLPNGYSANWTSGAISSEGTQDVIITFSPTLEGPFNGTVTVNNDLSDTNNTIPISGNGVSPLAFTGGLNFGDVMENTTADRTFTITNNSNQNVNISSINLPAAFTSNYGGGSITAQNSQDVTVTFAPTEIQDYSGIVTVNNDAGATNNTLSISANGIENTTALDITGFWISDIELLNCTAGGTSTDQDCLNHSTFDGLQLEFVEDLAYNFCENTSTSCGLVFNDGVYTNTEVFIERSFNFDGVNLFMEIKTYSTSGFFFDTRTFEFNGVYDEINEIFAGTYSHDTDRGLWNNLSSGNMTLTRP